MTILTDLSTIPRDLAANRAAGAPWIREHTDALKAHGWTREEVLDIGTLSYPLGGWGLIWSDSWRDGNLIKVEIEEDGAVAFHLQDAGKVSVMRRRCKAWRCGSIQLQTQPLLEARP